MMQTVLSSGQCAKTIRVALAGNPNSGKTTIFNNLTGARQHVGNYPGVTVEKKAGRCSRNGLEFEVVDLPGAYSLTAYSPEELIARQYLVEERPDAVVVVLDASNLERNLYLAVQLIEMGAPVVVACNVMDVVAERGDVIDVAELARLLDVPAVATVGSRRQGMNELLDVAARVAGVGWRNREFCCTTARLRMQSPVCRLSHLVGGQLRGARNHLRHARYAAARIMAAMVKPIM